MVNEYLDGVKLLGKTWPSEPSLFKKAPRRNSIHHRRKPPKEMMAKRLPKP